MVGMPSKPPVIFPSERKLLVEFGERLRMARLRRKWAVATVAGRAGVSRTTVYHVEAGDASVTLGTYMRVLAVLGLQNSVALLAADDKVGRALQDAEIDTRNES
jgi:transcriptional regulator with XRE-family HTH domain